LEDGKQVAFQRFSTLAAPYHPDYPVLEFSKPTPSRKNHTNAMPAKNGFALQDGDIELLRYAFLLRLATVDHLSALSGRSVRALWGRLLKLKERRYLASVTRVMQKQVYAVGSKGVPILIEHGYAAREFANKRVRHHELSEFGIRHSLFIADIHARMLLLTRTGPITLADWQEGSALSDSVIPDKDDPPIPVRPTRISS
jgi:hypothetical protein